LLLTFSEFEQIEEFTSLNERIAKCKDELRFSVLALFENRFLILEANVSFTKNGAISGDVVKLQDACVAVDALNSEARS
jgi:hypothetical protein